MAAIQGEITGWTRSDPVADGKERGRFPKIAAVKAPALVLESHDDGIQPAPGGDRRRRQCCLRVSYPLD
jgi:hypothetical protein